jgi:Domain of unknown function (DUF4278)
MKLTYRGTHYEHNPLNPVLAVGETSGKYRGVNWKHCYPRHIPQQPVAELKYRGVAYHVGDPVDVEMMVLSKQYTNDTTSAPKVCQVKKFGEELAKTHLNNICQDLERRLQVAKQKGDENLVRLLEEEARQIAC